MMSELHESADGALTMELLWRRWASAGIVVHVHSQHSEKRLLGLTDRALKRLLQKVCHTLKKRAPSESAGARRLTHPILSLLSFQKPKQ